MIQWRSQWIVLVIQAISIWPAWLWLGKRLGHPEHAACTIAAAAGLVFVLFSLRTNPLPERRSTSVLCSAIALMLLYAVLLPFTPMIVAVFPAILCTVLLAASAMGPVAQMPVAIWGLALLMLPTVPVLQEVVGYPMRALATNMAAVLLRGTGLPIEIQGLTLGLGERIILVDASCSGVRMLWTMGFVCFLFSGLRRLKWRAHIVACSLAFALILLANAMRVASLFYVETGMVPAMGGIFHTGVGVIVFAFAIIAQIGGIEWLASRQRA